MSTFSFRLVYKPHCLRNSYFLLISTIIWFQFHCNEWHVSFSLLWMTYLDECHVSIRMPVQPWTLEDDALDLSRKMCRFLYMIVVWCVATVGPTCRCPVCTEARTSARGRRRRAQAQARGSGEASGRCRERERARAPVTLRQTTSSNDLKLTCSVFQMCRSPAPSPVLKRSWLNWHSDWDMAFIKICHS